MSRMKRGFLISILALFGIVGLAQEEYVKWEVTSNSLGNETFELNFNVSLDGHWHMYSQHLNGDIGQPTVFSFELGNDFELQGETKESNPIVAYEEVLDAEVSYFEKNASFSQLIQRTNPEATNISGSIEYMICEDGACLPPATFEYTIDLTSGKEVVEEVDEIIDTTTIKIIPELPNLNLDAPVNPDCGEVSTSNQGNWMLFAFGLIFGFLSLFTPCVFPMIPLTVSFFTKGGSESGKGTAKALLYGLSIVAVYVSLSLPFYASGTDPEVLNEISTSFLLNIIFFAIFIFFAFSFFGYYEIALPASWANKADKAADKGGVIGVIFMAVVLAIVSFSCTGPLLGAVLGESLSKGPVPITFAMLGFGLGLGLPFSIFAMFPSLMKKMPQSGGWLNNVKVVLGFIELAFALKFLSNADYVYQYHIIERETFFLVWAILAFATAFYLLGFFRFPHDSKSQSISNIRKGIALAFIGFAVYLIPGIFPDGKQWWNTSLVAGFPPAKNYSWYDQGDHHFLDFEEAEKYANKVDKPILIDFTGYACVNCRKMEENVWTDQKVKKLLDEYVIVSLYVDDKNELPKEQQGSIEIELYDGTKKQKKIVTIGNKWATFESLRFKQISQPYYVLLSPDGYLLTNPVGYQPDPEAYAEWLECGLDAYKKLKKGGSTQKEEIAAKPKQEKKIEKIVAAEWSYTVEPLENNEYNIIIDAKINSGWHLYSQFLTGDVGPNPTEIVFDTNPKIEIIGSTAEKNVKSIYDKTWDMEIQQFESTATFIQKIKATSPTNLTGAIQYMACDDSKCVNLFENFNIEIK